MIKSELIVLLGQENDTLGKLSSIALNRADHAVALAKIHPNAKLLATGAFGPNFNTSDRTHSHHLHNALVERGVDPGRIMETHVSARTLEDAFVVRSVLANHPDIERVIIVTSDYHMPRTQYIFGRVLPTRDLEFNAVFTPGCKEEKKNEIKAFDRERRNWINLPLLTVDGASSDHTTSVYESATADQKAYDQLSYAVVAGAFVAFFAPYLIDAKIEQWQHLASFALSGVVTLVLFSIYLRMAMWANTARQVMYLIEVQWEVHGLSYTARHGLPMGDMPAPLRLLSRMGIVTPLACVIAAMIMVQIGSAAASIYDWVVPPLTPEIRAPTKV